MLKKILCISLILCMLLPMTIACQVKEKNEGGESESQSDVVLTPDDETPSDSNSEVVEIVDPPTPMKDDFGGYEFRVLTRGNGAWGSDDITGKIDGSTVAIATYKRNAMLKSKYNFDIVEFKETDIAGKIRASMESGDVVYDMYGIGLRDVTNFTQEGNMVDLNTIDSLNLDAAYFDQSTREQGSFGGYLFFLTGDMIYQDDSSASGVAFNYTLWDKYKLTEMYNKTPYQLVKDFEWTYEKLVALSKPAVDDLNGDKIMDSNDQYGMCVENASMLAFLMGMDSPVLKKDANDELYFEPDGVLMANVQELADFWNSGAACDAFDPFIVGQSTFSHIWLMDLTSHSKMNLEFGVVPMPMKEEGRNNYHSMCQTYGSNCITISKAIADPELSANIIELISYASMDTLTPALNTWLFEGRGVQHPEDLEMVDIICDTKTYELANLYSYQVSAAYDSIKEIVHANGEGMDSKFKAAKDSINTAVANILKNFNENA